MVRRVVAGLGAVARKAALRAAIVACGVGVPMLAAAQAGDGTTSPAASSTSGTPGPLGTASTPPLAQPPPSNVVDPTPPPPALAVPAGLVAASADTIRSGLSSWLRIPHFGGAPTLVSLHAFVDTAKPTPSVVLYAVRLHTAAGVANAAEAIRDELAATRPAPALGDGAGGNAPAGLVAESSAEKRKDRLIEAKQRWHGEGELVHHVRMLFAHSAIGVSADVAECLSQTPAAAALCTKALASLRSTVAEPDRLDVELLTSGGAAVPTISGDATTRSQTSPTLGPASPHLLPEGLGEGLPPRPPIHTAPPASAKPPLTRHVWVLGGLLLLLAGYLWNRARRAELDKAASDASAKDDERNDG